MKHTNEVFEFGPAFSKYYHLHYVVLEQLQQNIDAVLSEAEQPADDVDGRLEELQKELLKLLSRSIMWRTATRPSFPVTFICRCRKSWSDEPISTAEPIGRSVCTAVNTHFPVLGI